MFLSHLGREVCLLLSQHFTGISSNQEIALFIKQMCGLLSVVNMQVIMHLGLKQMQHIQAYSVASQTGCVFVKHRSTTGCQCRGQSEEEKQDLLMQLINETGQLHTMQGRMNSMVHGTLRTVIDEKTRFQNSSVGYHLKRNKS